MSETGQLPVLRCISFQLAEYAVSWELFAVILAKRRKPG
jgi:hypothetical protein